MDDRAVPSVGAIAPDFTLLDVDDSPVRLSEYRGDSCVVLYFMRAFGCLPCRAHARRLSAQKIRLKSYGAAVAVIGPGTREEAAKLAAKMKKPIPVLADETGEVAAAYGFRRVLFRTVLQSGTVVVDRDGVIRYVRRVTNPSASLDEDGLFLALRHL